MLGVWKNRGHMDNIILLDRNAYLVEDYQFIRKHNREVFKEDPEEYCREQINFEFLYEVSVKGNVYYLNDFLNGMYELRNSYHEDIQNFITYADVFNLRHRLPQNSDYFIRFMESNFSYKMYFISHTNMFECVLTPSNQMYFKVYYGTQEEAEKLFNIFYK